MKKLLLSLEEALPHWLGTPQIQWAQWAYGIWQVVRGNALTLFVLSLPVYLWTIRCKKKVVVVGETRDYVMPLEDMMNRHQWKTLTIKEYKHDNKLCFLKYGEYYYFAHTNTLQELAECERIFGENVVFVEKLLSITGGISVGKMLSETEAYEKILSGQGYHISVGPPCVAPSFLDYVDVSSKFWGVLSAIPILLQAKSYNRVSTLLSFLLILLDLNRHWLYRFYDGVFQRFAKIVKLCVFKERKYLYHIFSLFSSRWNYAYVLKLGEIIRIRTYCKLKSMFDLSIYDFHVYGDAAKFQNLCLEVVIDRAHVSNMQYDEVYILARLGRSVYVPAAKLQWTGVADGLHIPSEKEMWESQSGLNERERILRERERMLSKRENTKLEIIELDRELKEREIDLRKRYLRERERELGGRQLTEIELKGRGLTKWETAMRWALRGKEEREKYRASSVLVID